MKKNLCFIFILIFLTSILGCSKSISKPIPITKKESTVNKPYGKSVPVLMYHSITSGKSDSNSLPIETFKEQMKYLKDNGYQTITLTDLYKYFMNQKPLPEKSVVLTFDDGYENNYTAMFPVLKEYNFKAAIFVITSHIDKDHEFMTSKQLLEMDKYGVDIESHTVNHDKLKSLSKDKQLATLIQSKKDLEKILKKEINFFAYPGGAYNKSAIEAVNEAGYKMAFTIDGKSSSWSSKNDGLLSLHRVDVSSFQDLNAFKTGISNADYKSLFQ
ncbi:polysaccharide deacetylase family protein [Clostridium sp. CF011]|uniref:polysaccharide deacetylase family protein n=1 Tax=Clostridium sp. CF011 TaxID=2843318 RepID=UPI001C0DC18E|nr:polysaccharide deacetylase family protein [Clostridium sp. CF011]MBU3091212.1 polysaccharide deacetylase family protein [Clostridium sp. CF011]WAG68522.1 polysaccharide deacetylase family protein [Clostridium sp. CF011]